MLDGCDMEFEDRLSAAEIVLGHKFADRSDLRRALTHPSCTEESHSRHDYERLEFLGDAVLGLVIVDEIFRRSPQMPEGSMTKLKIGVVSGATLSAVARNLGLGELIFMGPSERADDSRGLPSALENAFEALVAALYLDAGLSKVREFILRVLGDRIDPDVTDIPEHPKSLLQEYAQARGSSPEYVIRQVDGPPHARMFNAAVVVDGRELGAGRGRSKKEAEMNAAIEALSSLDS